MTTSEKQLNTFLVEVFNDVLRLEESNLSTGSYRNLSVSELHLLDAARTLPADTALTMTALSRKLGVSAGSLTVAVKALEQKGYLCRKKCEIDKRRVLVQLTDTALGACEAHRQFHEKMIADISDRLSQKELASLDAALRILHAFFTAL
ncbi:MAG: MarR family transcriptional regulator [Pygmaiobacter sp.]